MSTQIHWKKVSWIAWMVILMGVWHTPAPAFQLGGRDTKDWIERLERPDRIKDLKIEEVLANLNLKPGLIIADIGAGSGVFSRPLAKAVAPTGKVFSVDIDQGLLDYIAQRAKQEKIQNIQPVLGKFDDPNLPTRQVDLVFIHDVLHHIKNRQTYLKNLATYLKPDARIALIEMNSEDPNTPHHDQPDLQLGKDQVNQWLETDGFHPAEEFDLFEGKKWFVIYSREAAPSHEDMDHMM